IAKDAIVARGALASQRRIDLGLARETATRVRGDPASLAILLSNLLDNALRYTPEGGKIDVALDNDDHRAVLTVADTGSGIPVEERARVFDRFFRGSDNREPGSGLGLSIVKRIADAHHAAIELGAPERGSGLVVTVRFPAPAGGSGDSHRGPPWIARCTGRSVLITGFGQPVAEVIPPRRCEKKTNWLGSMAGRATIVGDIVGPVADPEIWEALRRWTCCSTRTFG